MRLAALGLRDFSVALWALGGPVSITTGTWKIIRDDYAPDHLNAILAPRCDFHTFRDIPLKRRVLAVFVRRGTSIYWYVNGVLDNEDHGCIYDLPAETAVVEGYVNVVEHAMVPFEINALVRGRWPP